MRVACLWFDHPVETSKIAEQFLRFSPQICLRKDEAVFVEIGKCNRLYAESTFLARAQVILRRNGEKARIVIGNDITDALTLAKYGAGDVASLPLAALLDFADPFDRDEVVRKQSAFLVETFRDLGVKTIGDLQRVPISELISRYGIVGRHCFYRIHFQDFVNWPLWTPEEKIVEFKQLPYFEFYGELEPILFELKAQLDAIFPRVRARQKRLTHLRVTIVCEKNSFEPNPQKVFDFEFFSPQGETKGTLRILKERLGRFFEKDPIKTPIEGIRTEVIKLVPFQGAQKNIFHNDEEKYEQIFSLHNQLVEILGKENVFQAQLTEDRRPEKSWKKGFGNPHVAKGPVPDLANLIPRRLTYLCRYPVKIEITAGFLFIKEKRYRILHWDPEFEKITGGWFENPQAQIQNTFDRKYSRVQIEGSRHLSVFETPSGNYYLHGYDG